MSTAITALASHHGAAVDYALDALVLAVAELKSDHTGMADLLAPKNAIALRIARADQPELALAIAQGLQRVVNALANPATKDYVRLNVDALPMATVTQALRASADHFNALEGTK